MAHLRYRLAAQTLMDALRAINGGLDARVVKGKVVTRNSILTALVLCVTALVLFTISGFEREYVMRSGDLLDLRAALRHDGIAITGSLLASGARVTGLTLTRYGNVILLRVYAAPIKESDDPHDIRGAFAALIPRDPSLTGIMVGDDSGWLTLGHVHGFPVRVWRLRRDDSVSQVVWQP